MQFRAKRGLECFGCDDHEGLQGEIPGISDAADTDVMKGIFSPRIAQKTKP